MTSLTTRVVEAPRWLLPAVSAAAAAMACTTVALVDPNEAGRYPTCPFLALTGRWCPGCGSLRGLHQLLRGDMAAAVGFNVLLVAAVPFVLWSWLAWALPRFGGPRVPSPAALPVARAVLVVVLAFWVLRNLPWGPLPLLAP
jgi:hypothetical protein